MIIATEGTRTYARQLYLWQNRNRPGFNPAWHPDNALAYHLSGRAVDVGSSVGYLATINSREFYARAGKYGFRATVRGEPWHFEFRPEWASILPAALTATPISEEAPRDMPDYSLVRGQHDDKVYLSVDRMFRRWIPSPSALEDVRYVLRGVGAGAADKDVEVVANPDAYGIIVPFTETITPAAIRDAVASALKSSPIAISDAEVAAIGQRIVAAVDVPTAAENAAATVSQLGAALK